MPCPLRSRVRVISFGVHCLGEKTTEQKGSAHVAQLTPTLSARGRLLLQLNMQSVAGNPTLLLGLRRRDAIPSFKFLTLALKK